MLIQSLVGGPHAVERGLDRLQFLSQTFALLIDVFFVHLDLVSQSLEIQVQVRALKNERVLDELGGYFIVVVTYLELPVFDILFDCPYLGFILSCGALLSLRFGCWHCLLL